MPLEISEIGVHIAVGGAGPSGPEGGSATASAPDTAPGGGAALTPAQEDAIVSRCVQQVLANLKAEEAR